MFLEPTVPQSEATQQAATLGQQTATSSTNVDPTRRAQSLGDTIEYFKNVPAPELLIRGIKLGNMGFMFGVPKSGKTTCAEQLLLSIAAERSEFNGYALKSPHKVCMFVSFEEHATGRNERNQMQLKNFTEEEQEKIKKNFIVSNQDMPRFIMQRDDWNKLEEEISFYNPGVVVIDSLSRLTLDDNGSEEVAKQIMKKLREITDKYNCTMIIISHTPKGANEKPLTIASMSGSRIFMQEADFLIGVNRVVNTRYMKLIASRYDRDDDDEVDVFEINENRCVVFTMKADEMAILTQLDGRFNNAATDHLFRGLQQVAAEKGIIRTRDIQTIIGESVNRQTVHDNIDKLIGNRQIERTGKGEYKIVK